MKINERQQRVVFMAGLSVAAILWFKGCALPYLDETDWLSYDQVYTLFDTDFWTYRVNVFVGLVLPVVIIGALLFVHSGERPPVVSTNGKKGKIRSENNQSL